jgi:hypothetical protein
MHVSAKIHGGFTQGQRESFSSESIADLGALAGMPPWSLCRTWMVAPCLICAAQDCEQDGKGTTILCAGASSDARAAAPGASSCSGLPHTQRDFSPPRAVRLRTQGAWTARTRQPDPARKTVSPPYPASASLLDPLGPREASAMGQIPGCSASAETRVTAGTNSSRQARGTIQLHKHLP